MHYTGRYNFVCGLSIDQYLEKISLALCDDCSNRTTIFRWYGELQRRISVWWMLTEQETTKFFYREIRYWFEENAKRRQASDISPYWWNFRFKCIGKSFNSEWLSTCDTFVVFGYHISWLKTGRYGTISEREQDCDR